jgi:zinc protease
MRSRLGGSVGGAAAVLILVVTAPAARAQWPAERPPRPLAASEVRFPPFEIRTLANGLEVVAVPHHEQPTVSMRLLVRAGSAQDPPAKPGLASLVAALLDQGTATRSAQQIAEAIDSVGGALGTGAGADLSFVNVVVIKDSFDLALDLVSEIARQPAFAADEVERQRQQVLSGLRVSYEDPDYVAGVVFDRLVYGFHPYGLPNNGTPETIAQITRDDLVAFHAAHFTPNNAILAVVGDMTPEEAFTGAERAFGSWARRAPPVSQPVDAPPPTRRLLVIDKPGAVQTEIRVGHVAIPRKHPDYMPLNLAIRILGGEGSNRLHRVLRSERGLTYGVSADLETLKTSGHIEADTDTRSSATAEALRLIVDEFWTLQREMVNERELADAKAYMTGSFPLTIETPDAIALQVLNAVFYGLDLKELQNFRERVNAVTVDAIRRVAETYLKPDRLSIVLVGDASAFADGLRGLGFGKFERISLAELDLAAPDFRRGNGPGRGAPARNEPPAAASEEGAAGARAVIERAVTACGGLDRLKAVRTLRADTRTTIATADGPIEAETITYIQYPDRFRVDAKLPAGDVVQAFADGAAWIRNPLGVQTAPPELRDAFQQTVRRDLIALLIAASTGAVTVRAAADASEGGRSLKVVEISGPELQPVSLYVDPATGFVVKQTYREPGPGGPQLTEQLFSDYRRVDGLAFAFTAEVRRGGAKLIERRLHKVSVNLPLDPALFQKPGN